MSAIPREAHVIIVGDVDQLPPIGAGFVLKDLLDSDMVPYTRLQHIYRQSSGIVSSIVRMLLTVVKCQILIRLVMNSLSFPLTLLVI